MDMNKRQIEEFINTVQPENELNELAITYYCRTFLGVRAVFKKDNADLPKINLEQFKQYVHEGIFHSGDVVFDETQGGMGIVHSANFKTLSLVAYVDKDGAFSEMPVEAERVNCRIATKEEMFEIQRRLYKAGLGWNKRKCTLFKQKYIPQENQQVRLSALGKKMGLGVFKEIDADGRIIMYCVKMEDEDARYSLHDVVGKAEDYQIDLISTYERNIFTEQLKQAGVIWNGHLKQIKLINHRVDKGETYYYLDDIFEIVPATDKYTARDTKRLVAGNYFTSPDKADRLLKAVFRETARGVDKMRESKDITKRKRNGGRGAQGKNG